MKFLSFLVVFIFSMQISNAIVINEIMADPIADETLNEWVELYNDENKDVNASGWIIGDDNDNDTIQGGLYNNEGTIIPAFGYAIITDDATRVYNNFNVSNDAVRLYADDASIGNGLGNDGETIYIYDNNGYLLTEIGEQWDSQNNIWTNYSRGTYTNDINGNVLIHLYESWDSQNNSWSNNNRYTL